MDFEKIYLFRITHIENLPHVQTNGVTHRNSSKANSNFIPIGDPTLIHTRRKKVVEVTNGQDGQKAFSIVLGDYIPFYFGTRMPMLYVIQNGGNFVDEAINPEHIVYIVSTLKKIIDSGLNFYFSDGHATDAFTTFYDKNHVGYIKDIIDWNAVKMFYWGGSENLNEKRKKQAELLVKGDIDTNLISGYICYNAKAQKKLKATGIPTSKF